MEEIEQLLLKVSLFKEFTPEEVELLKQYFTYKTYKAKEIVFKEGDKGEELFIIEKGRVTIIKQVKEETETVITHLGYADFFGELTMFEDFPRTATVKTLTDCSFLVITHTALRKMLEQHPHMAAKFLLALVKELANRIQKTNMIIKETLLWRLNALIFK